MTGRPESVIGNRLLSLLAVPLSKAKSSEAVAPRLFTFCGAPRWGIDVATKISSAMTIAPAPMITNRFCWICCRALCFALVASLGQWGVCVRREWQVVVASFLFL